MEAWFTVNDLAGLPGMPSTRRAVQMWGQKNLASSRSKERGKGREYPIHILPEETQRHLRARATDDALSDARMAESIARLEAEEAEKKAQRALAIARREVVEAELTAHQRHRGLQRRLVVGALLRIRSVEGGSTRHVVRLLLQRAEAGQLTPMLMRQLRESLDERGRAGKATRGERLPDEASLRRWLAAHDAGRTLAPMLSKTVDLSARPWYRPLFAYVDRPQKPTLKAAHAELLRNWSPQWADKPGAAPPSYDAVVRAYAKRSRLDRIKGQHTGSALRARTFYHQRTYHGLPPAAEMHADGWTTHFTAPHPVSGEYVTYEVWHCHDTATRYVTPLAVGLSENSDVILQALQRFIAVLGVPAVWQTDHTSSVKNARVMDQHSGLAERLGISVVHPQEVGNSQANGIAESFNRWLDGESRALVTYQNPARMDSGSFVRIRRITNAMVKAGDDHARRVALRRQALALGKGLLFETFDEAVAWLQERVRVWNTKPHRSLPKVRDAAGRMVHMTPQQSLDAAISAGWEPVRLTEAELLDEFRPHLRKKVTRGCVVPFNGQRYHHADLAHHEGEEVLVCIEPTEPRHVWVKDIKGRLIACAGFVGAVSPRTESMVEHTERKRAEAQVHRRERQIAAIGERIAPPVIDLPAPPLAAALPAPVADVLPMAPPLVPLRREEPAQLSYAETLERIAQMEEAAAAAKKKAAEQ